MKQNRGFTLVELLISVAVLAILLGVAAPPLRDFVMNASVTSQTNDLMTALATARSEATKARIRYGICTSTNGTTCTNSEWHQGWIVFADADSDGDLDAGTFPTRTQAAADPDISLTSTGHSLNGTGARYLSYRPSGALDPATPLPVVFTLCDTRTVTNVGDALAANKGRSISISASGRPTVQRITCS